MSAEERDAEVSEAPRQETLVLVVDDERDIRALISMRLEQAGYKVDTAVDGKQGLQMTTDLEPDLVVLDVHMPGETDGYELTRQIRAQAGTTADTPVLLLSATADENDIDVGLVAGANDYLMKPFKAAELRSRVRILLGAKAQKEVPE